MDKGFSRNVGALFFYIFHTQVTENHVTFVFGKIPGGKNRKNHFRKEE